MDVGGLRLDSSDLALGLATLLQLRHLLALNRGRRDLLTKDDITDLARRQGRDIDAVPLSEVLLR